PVDHEVVAVVELGHVDGEVGRDEPPCTGLFGGAYEVGLAVHDHLGAALDGRDDGRGVADGLGQALGRVGDIAFDQFQTVECGEGGRLLLAGARSYQGSYGDVLVEQCPDDVAAEQPGGTGDEDLGHVRS